MNSLCTISGHGFRGVGKSNLPPSAITSVAATTVTATSIVFTWSGGLAQDANTVTMSYTMNGSGASPSSSGTGTATFTGLTTATVYNFGVTATNIAGNTTNSVKVTTVGLVYNFPFQNDVLDYHTGSGVSVGSLGSANIYWSSTGGYKGGGCLYSSVYRNSSCKFTFPAGSLIFLQSLGFSVAFWFKGVSGAAGAVFCVGSYWTRYWIGYDDGNQSMCVYDPLGNGGDAGSNNVPQLTWVHCCWVVPPNTGNTYFYINGGSVNGGQTITMPTTTAQSFSCSNAGVFYDNEGTPWEAQGWMNNLNIFNYAITQAQITTLYQA